MPTSPSQPAPAPRLVLASGSPRRQQLLREARYDFVVEPANIDEDDYPQTLAPGDVAEFLASQKAQAVATSGRRLPGDVVLAADTVVAMGDLLLGKPEDEADARRMLSLLAGTTHLVITGVAVVRPADGFARRARVMSGVHMRHLSRAEIDRYVASGDWQGKAGGYGIQDDDPFVTRMTGSLSNIVGLPMERTAELLAEAGVRPAEG